VKNGQPEVIRIGSAPASVSHALPSDQIRYGGRLVVWAIAWPQGCGEPRIADSPEIASGGPDKLSRQTNRQSTGRLSARLQMAARRPGGRPRHSSPLCGQGPGKVVEGVRLDRVGVDAVPAGNTFVLVIHEGAGRSRVSWLDVLGVEAC
jgi:hypothetical protein